MKTLLRKAVDAYDAARIAAHGSNTAPMSEANKQHIAPLIQAAIAAVWQEEPQHIVTRYEFPSIGRRDFDWCAHRQDYEPPDSDGIGGGLLGWGRTEAAAVADLLQLEAEKDD